MNAVFFPILGESRTREHKFTVREKVYSEHEGQFFHTEDGGIWKELPGEVVEAGIIVIFTDI